ncbi:MAG: 3-isopropylmalate dehydrogenase, partial [Bacteroidales bacterium]|nr:3-isopropylmalate dehydrogenase [Bacteroidales bacterium]
MKLNIAKLPGDGIGPEVVEQAVKAVDAVCRRFGHEVNYTFAEVGACAIDKYGSAFPESTYKVCL